MTDSTHRHTSLRGFEDPTNWADLGRRFQRIQAMLIHGDGEPVLSGDDFYGEALRRLFTSDSGWMTRAEHEWHLRGLHVINGAAAQTVHGGDGGANRRRRRRAPSPLPDGKPTCWALHHHGGSVQVAVVHAAGGPVGLARPGGGALIKVRRVCADAEGWYRLIDDRWPWRHVSPPALPPRCAAGERRQYEPDIFEPDGPDGTRCTVCGATGYDIAHQGLPSMAGYGTDHSLSCRICGSSETYGEEIGWSSHPTIWPPDLDPAPTADGEVTRP